MRCPRCQHENRPQAKFCEECASPVNGASPTAPSYAELKTEVERIGGALTDALEQQTATSEILQVIASSPTDIQPVMDVVAENAARYCGATDAVIYRLEGDLLRLVAAHGPLHTTLVPIGGTIAASPGSVAGRAMLARRTIHIEDLLALPETEYPETVARSRRSGIISRTVLVTPLFREGVPIGAIYVRRSEVRPFTDKQVESLKTFANQAVIAIENVRLFQELQTRNRELTEALGRETASADLLRVISSSPTDLGPVFETIVDRALRLCGATIGGVARYEGGLVSSVAVKGPPGLAEAVRAAYPRRLTDSGLEVRAIRERTTVHVADVLADPSSIHEIDELSGFRAQLSVPMLKDGDAIGARSPS